MEGHEEREGKKSGRAGGVGRHEDLAGMKSGRA